MRIKCLTLSYSLSHTHTHQMLPLLPRLIHRLLSHFHSSEMKDVTTCHIPALIAVMNVLDMEGDRFCI